MDMVHLVGAEQVQSAARTIREAAGVMERAASSINDSLFRHQQFLDQWLAQFEAVVQKIAVPAKDGP